MPVVAPPMESPSQTDLVQRAWKALSAGEWPHALAIVDEDAHLHPDGQFTEEREVINVLALARLHRAEEANRAAALFIERYPSSVHRARIEQAIREEMP